MPFHAAERPFGVGVRGQLEQHVVRSCRSFCQAVVSLHVARQHLGKSLALPCLLLHCFQIKACLKGEFSLQMSDLKKKRDLFTPGLKRGDLSATDRSFPILK